MLNAQAVCVKSLRRTHSDMPFSSIETLLEAMIREKASDLYLTFGAPASLRVEDHIAHIGAETLDDTMIEQYLETLLTEEQRDEFETTLEYNTAIEWKDNARFRINAFRQQQHSGLVIRRINTEIPTIESLKLPSVYADLIMEKRGLILVVGASGSGKTTSLAAMVNHRNHHGFGHIITIEDPIEFIHHHHKCIITQRDVGVDTFSYGMALKNALRQRPDVIVIGEIRDREAMENALNFAETGHVCVATLHANNAHQTIERILSFFPEEKHRQVLTNLAVNLKGVLSQRLVDCIEPNKRILAVEIMLNNGLIKQLIAEGKLLQIRELIERGTSDGMCTMEQSLITLFNNGIISSDVAISESDNPANMRLALRKDHVVNKANIESIMKLSPGYSRNNESEF